jgi:hypothetical protein
MSATEVNEIEEVTTVSTAQPEQVVKKTTVVSPSPVRTEHPQKVFEKKKVIFRTYQVIWYILAIIEILLAFRVAFRAIGANPYSGFANLIYALSDPLALPFSGILATPVSGSSVFEWSTIIAAIVYALIAYGLVYLLQIVKPVTPHEVEESVDNPTA